MPPEIIHPNILSSGPDLKTSNTDSISAIVENSSFPDTVMDNELPSQTSNLRGLYVHAGLNIYPTNASSKNKVNLSPLAGLEYVFPVSQSFYVGLAGLYSVQSGYQLRDTATVASYFLDRNTSTQTIDIHSMHIAYFPLTIYYMVANKHFISGAVQASYLINTKGNFSELNKIEGRSTESHQNNVNGYMDGIKRSTMALSLGYRYRLSERFNITTRVAHEMTSPYTMGYFQGIHNKSSWSVQTGLTIKLF